MKELREKIARVLLDRAGPMHKDTSDNPIECWLEVASTILDTISDAGYVIGKLRWIDNFLMVGTLRIGHVEFMFDREAMAEARVALEAATRRALAGDA